jgi:2-polyprenyl-3-methyl-5-hydroxy-6-metoxy-1,4-benzoquinol methylase
MNIEEYSKYKQFYTGKAPKLLLKYLNLFYWNNFLDLGCGDGSLLYALNKKNYLDGKKVYAIDLSENRINLVKKINKNFVCFVDDACNIKEIKDNNIDFIVSEQVIEHVEDDDAMAKEIYRILRLGGIIYLSTVFKKWYGWYFYKCNGKWRLDPTHIREYNNEIKLLKFFPKEKFELLENKKTVVKRSIIDFIFKRFGVDREIFIKFPFFQWIRNVKIFIPGYYNWEIVLKKK